MAETPIDPQAIQRLRDSARAHTGDARLARALARRVAASPAKHARLLSLLSLAHESAPYRAKGMIVHAPGGPVTRTKASAAPMGLVEGYVLTWGHPQDRDLEGEYFTPETELCYDWFEARPALYHHGMDGTMGLKTIGSIRQHQADDLGVWVQAQLRMQDEYARAVYDMVAAKDFGWSSGSVEHLVQVEKDGRIQRWPWIEGSITPSPAQPAKTTVYPVKMSMAAYQALMAQDGEFRSALKGLQMPAGSRNAVQSNTGEHTMGTIDYKALVRRALGAKADELSEDEIAAMAEDLEDEMDATQGLEGTEDDEYAVMGEDDYDEAYMADDEYDDEALMGFDYRAEDDLEDDAAMAYGLRAEAMDTEEEIPVSMPENVGSGAVMSRSRRTRTRQSQARRNRQPIAPPRRRKKSVESFYDYDPRADYEHELLREVRSLRRQVKAIQRMPAPGEATKGLGSRLQVTQPEEDRKERYVSAFKNYLKLGLAGVFDDDKRVLYAHGDDRKWGAAASMSQYDAATKSMKVLNIAADNSVGFAVPPDWITELNKNIMAATVMAPECKKRTTTSDRIVQPDLVTTDARRAYSNVNVSWPGETVAAGTAHRATEFSLGQIDIPIHVMLISMLSTLSALEDVAYDLPQEITESFTEAASVAYDQLIWSGDGAGKMAGIVNNTRVTGSASVNHTTVGGYLASGDAATILSGDPIWDMLYHFPPQYLANAKFYTNPTTMGVLKKLKDGDGRYLWDNEGTGLAGGMPTSLVGRPVVVNGWADQIAANAFPLILADLSAGYMIGQRVDFSVRRFDEVYADLDQVLFIGRARIGGQVIQPAAFKALKIAVS